MVHYFRLQLKMLNRHLAELGVPPWLGYLLGFFVFLGFSLLLFDRTGYAAYLYALVALSFVSALSESRRNDFLRSAFSDRKYFTLRALENMGVAFPFLVFLFIQKAWWIGLGLLICSAALVFLHVSPRLNRSFPTPFSRYPFEFSVGFRKTLLFYPLAYFLTFQAVSVGNFNLGVFSLLLVILICVSYYTDPENKFYVWIYALPPKTFVLEKLRTALWYSTLACLPVTLATGLAFPAQLGYLLLFQLAGYLYLIMILLGKYTAFPEKMNLPQAILIAVAVWFPPFLLGVLPFFFRQAVKRLKTVLE